MGYYRIVNWMREFEVTAKGEPWTEGQALRRGPLQFVRHPAKGTSWSLDHRRMLTVSRHLAVSAAVVRGVWSELLSLTAIHTSEHRGNILDEWLEPLDIDGIADGVGFTSKDVDDALKVLMHKKLEWIEYVDSPYSPSVSETSGNSGDSGKSEKLPSTQYNTNQDKKRRKEKKEGEGEGADPFTPYPSLRAFYPELCRMLVEANDNKFEAPKAGSPKEVKWQKALRDLCRLKPNYKPDEVEAALRWVLTSEDKDATFWRKPFKSLTGLRVKTKDSELSKFGWMHSVWKDVDMPRQKRVDAQRLRDEAARKATAATSREEDAARAKYEAGERDPAYERICRRQELLVEYIPGKTERFVATGWSVEQVKAFLAKRDVAEEKIGEIVAAWGDVPKDGG